jgi:hypothetical protein
VGKAGSMLGSGGVVVIDDQTCIVEFALRTISFYQHESCGWCIPCREGTDWLKKSLTRFHAGFGTEKDIDNTGGRARLRSMWRWRWCNEIGAEMRERNEFSVQEVKKALVAVEPHITERQMEMLRAHYFHHTLSTGRLAKFAGYKGGYRIANLQYGILSRRIADELGFRSPGSQIYTIATVAQGRDEHGHWQWRMDRVFREALRELAWFKPARVADPADSAQKGSRSRQR